MVYGKYTEKLISMGLQPGTLKWKAARERLHRADNKEKYDYARKLRFQNPEVAEREKQRIKRRRSTAELRKIDNEKRCERRKRNPEKYNEQQRLWREKNRAEQNRKANERKAARREEIRKYERERRRKNNPTHGLRSLLWKFKNGDVGLDELLRSYSESLALLHEKCGSTECRDGSINQDT